MNKEQLEALCVQTSALAREVGSWILQQVGGVEQSQIEVKDLNSLVSFVDKTAEERLLSALGAMLPASKFIAEESAPDAKEDAENYFWIVDPLDGTTNFLHQIPFFSVSIALYFRGEILLGVVYEPSRDELFSSWRGAEGCFLNGSPVRVSERERFKDGLLATGFPYHDFGNMRHYLHLLEDLMQSVRGLRRLGSAALDLAYTACGRFDGFFEYSLSAWDVAAGAFLVQKAGGKVSDFAGGENYLFGRSIIAAAPNAHAVLRHKIAYHFDTM